MNDATSTPALASQGARDFVRVLWRRKLLLAAVGLVLGEAAIAFVLLRTPEYQSEAQVLVKIGRESVALDPTATTQRTVSVSSQRLHELNSELAILRSEELGEEVVRQVGPALVLQPGVDDPSTLDGRVRATWNRWFPDDPLDEEDPDALREDARDEFLGARQARLIADSMVLEVTYTHEDPETARTLLQSLLDAYYAKHLSVHQTAGSFRFFEEQVQKAEAQLKKAANAREAFAAEHQVTDLTEERQRLIAHAEALRQRRSDLGIQRQTLTDSLAALEARSRDYPDVGPGSSELVDRLREREQELRLQRLDLEGRYKEDSRSVQHVVQQLEDVEGMLEEALARQWTMHLDEQRLALPSLEAENDALGRDLETATERLGALAAIEMDLARFDADIELANASYRKYADSLEQARLNQALETQKFSNLRILQAPTLPLDPHGFPTWMLAAAAGLLALVLTLGIVALAEVMDDTLRTPDDVSRQVGLMAISVPRAPKRSWFGGGERAEQETQEALAGHAGVLVRAIRRQALDRHSPYTVRVVGTRQGVGSSTITAHLARTLADLGLRVAAVDGDPRAKAVRSLSSRLKPGAEDRPLLASLAPSRAIELLSDVPRITVTKDDEADVSEAEDEIEVVLADLPWDAPLNGNSRLAARCDAILLVAESDRTRASSLLQLREFVSHSGADLLGVILNKRPTWHVR